MHRQAILECVINVSEGARSEVVEKIANACKKSLLDVHIDAFHNRSVFTLAGVHVEEDARNLAKMALNLIDLSQHVGIHPRFGAVDVVPFVPLGDGTMSDAQRARNSFAQWMNKDLGVECMLYGPERSLPDLRRELRDAPPTNMRSGTCAVGARDFLIAYNVVVDASPEETSRIVKQIRRPGLRALALNAGGECQVSCNLIDPLGVDGVRPDNVYDLVVEHAPIRKTELVGLIPKKLLRLIPESRWGELDLGVDKTIEARLAGGLGWTDSAD